MGLFVPPKRTEVDYNTDAALREANDFYYIKMAAVAAKDGKPIDFLRYHRAYTNTLKDDPEEGYVTFKKMASPDDPPVSEKARGPKLHIALDREPKNNIELAWNILLPLLIKHGVRTSKIVTSSDLSRFQPGKEIVVYIFDSKPSLNWKEFVKEAVDCLKSCCVPSSINPLFRFQNDTFSMMRDLYDLPMSDKRRSSRCESAIIKPEFCYLSFNGLTNKEPIPKASDFEILIAKSIAENPTISATGPAATVSSTDDEASGGSVSAAAAASGRGVSGAAVAASGGGASGSGASGAVSAPTGAASERAIEAGFRTATSFASASASSMCNDAASTGDKGATSSSASGGAAQ